MKYVCDICGYVYDPAAGDPDNGVAPGTPWEAVPEDWVCPLCGVGKDQFSPEASRKTRRGSRSLGFLFFALRARIYIVGKLTTDVKNATLRLSYDRKRGRCGGCLEGGQKP